jgi:hypothetical protein
MFNPLRWKREHQAALIIAAALGVIAGAIFVSYQLPICGRGYYRIGVPGEYFLGINWTGFLARCWLTSIFWPTLGGGVGAAIVYVRQLLRA